MSAVALVEPANTLPADMNVSGARLPQAYEAAKTALAECASIDECMDWADKSAALASYARQSNDQTLLHHAQRIQGRAVRRCGELLKQFDGRPANASKQSDAADSLITRREAALDAGLSERQQVTAVRVANVPTETFEAVMEAPAPPTVTALADMGRQRREPPAAPLPPAPAGFTAATHALGAVSEFAEFCRKHDPLFVAGGAHPSERADATSDVGVCLIVGVALVAMFRGHP